MKTNIFPILIGMIVSSLMLLAIALWLQTPELFNAFNQAFCAH